MQGFEVVTAADGVAGVEAASAGGPDLVVIDISLPPLDGLQVLACLRQDPRTAELPALLLTAFNPRDYRQRAAALGVDEVLAKSEVCTKYTPEHVQAMLADVGMIVLDSYTDTEQHFGLLLAS